MSESGVEKETESADNNGNMSGIKDLSAMFRRVPVALYRTAPDGELLAANTALANVLGYSTVDELRQGLGPVDTVYVDPSQRPLWVEEITERGVVYDFDVELRRPDGSTVWVQDTARAIRDETGEVVFFEGALIDQTEKVKAQQAKDEFLATISHELRNPIAVMLGMGEELADGYDTFSDEERRDMAQMIARQADDAAWLIEDLLVAYRHDVSQVSVSPQDFEVTKEIERVLEVVDDGINLEVRTSQARVKADPRRTRQILRNLVSNALRYGGEDVIVQVEPIGDRVETRVCDSGPEISPQEVERIFRPFERGTGSDHPKSVGLGLSVARILARLMEGDLTYRHVDGMSCFVLSLPAR